VSPSLAALDFKPKTMKRPLRSPWRNVRTYEDCAGWLPDAREEIEHLERLEENWDSYGSRCIQQAAIKSAIRFIFDIRRGLVPMPNIAPVPGGGIGFHWVMGGRDLELEFTPDGHVIYLKSFPGSERDSIEGSIGSREEANSVLEWVAGM